MEIEADWNPPMELGFRWGIEIGTRIRLTKMENDPCPIEVGAQGTVVSVQDGRVAQLHVDWDNGRTLMLVPDDEFEVVDDYIIQEW